MAMSSDTEIYGEPVMYKGNLCLKETLSSRSKYLHNVVNTFKVAHWQHCIWRKTGNLINMLHLCYYMMSSFLNGSLIDRLLHLVNITGSLVC